MMMTANVMSTFAMYSTRRALYFEQENGIDVDREWDEEARERDAEEEIVEPCE